ncbi:MAG: transcription-repair coupling factor, partial [Rhodospirillales bacterium]|nr:transcription-repair coupling factor [Rhodospirillales bacterium]
MTALVPDRCLRALGQPGPTSLGGVPEGFAAAVLLGLAQAQAATVLYIARDDARLARLAAMLAFFDPDCAQVTFPAWDCLPYDRVSPRADIASRRLAVLVRLLSEGAARPRVVLTTVNAAVQRVPPRTMLADATLPLAAGASRDVETLLGYLERNGFVRAGTVMEAGDYAVRGGIVDIFPPNAERPVRLDFFGDVIETMHWFDPVSQRRAEPADALHLAPVSEVLLTPQSIARFRGAYRRTFGAVTGDDPLYEAVSAGRRYPGIEHWLPMFHEGLETLFDYVPEGPVLLDHRAAEVRDDRFETIADFYGARANPPSSSIADAPYHPVPPESLFLDAEEWQRLLAERPVVQCSPFVEAEGGADAGAREGRDFVAERTQQQGALFETVGEHIDRLLDSGLRILIASGGAGSRDRMVRLLQEHGVHGIEPVADWQGACALPPSIAAAAVLPLERGFVSTGLAVIAEQ